MKKLLLCTVLVLTLAAAMLLTASAVNVSSADDLVAIMMDASRWSEDITLTADIDLTGKNQQPIGTFAKPYTGTFDGKGYTLPVPVNAEDDKLTRLRLFGDEGGLYIHHNDGRI